MTPSRLRVVIGDDHHLLVEALRSSLQAAHDVVAVAHDPTGIVQAVVAHEPDVLLLDLSLPERNGIELLPAVRAAAPRMRVIVVTMHVDRVLAERALARGAHGYVPKDAGLEELERAIRIVAEGGTFVSPRVPPMTHRVTLDADSPALAALTPRQHEIVRLIADGCSSVEIAQRLGLTERTVAFHRANIRAKLGVDSARDLLRYAIMLGGAAEDRDPRPGA